MRLNIYFWFYISLKDSEGLVWRKSCYTLTKRIALWQHRIYSNILTSFLLRNWCLFFYRYYTCCIYLNEYLAPNKMCVMFYLMYVRRIPHASNRKKSFRETCIYFSWGRARIPSENANFFFLQGFPHESLILIAFDWEFH